MMTGRSAQERRTPSIGNILASSSGMDDDEIEVHCGRCGKSMIVRLADIDGKRLVDCVDCQRTVQPGNVPRLVHDNNPSRG
jgi:hypothetical protein